MNLLKTRRQLVLGVALLVLVGAVVYGFFTKQGPVQDQTSYEGLVTEEEVIQDEVTREYFLIRLGFLEAALAAQQDAYGEEFDWDLYLDIAHDAGQIGDLVKQREAYEDLLALNPINFTAWNNYGNVLTFMEDYDAAENAYYQALELNATEDHFRDYIGFLEAFVDDSDQRVREMLELGVEVHGQTRYFMVSLGEWYFERGDCEHAISHYEIAAANDPDFEDIQDRLGEIESACE